MPEFFLKNKETLNSIEKGKNPGLGIRELHRNAIDGRGIHVAIIDQNLDVNHPEYKDSICSFKVLSNSNKEEISMHGPAVISILAGNTVGVAPKSQVHYYNVSSGGIENNLNDHINAVNDIISYNNSVSDKNKIRIISLSAGIGKNIQEWENKKKEAIENGIVFLDSSQDSDEKFGYICGGSNSDKDDFNTYDLPKWIKDKGDLTKIGKIGRMIVPSDYRTYASSWTGVQKYEYCEEGGISWSIPYFAGVLALALQINPKLKEDDLSKIVKNTMIQNKNNCNVINPQGIINKAKDMVK